MTVFNSVFLPRLQIIEHNFAIICQAFPSRLQTWLNNTYLFISQFASLARVKVHILHTPYYIFYLEINNNNNKLRKHWKINNLNHDFIISLHKLQFLTRLHKFAKIFVTHAIYLNYFVNRKNDLKDSRKNFVERNRRSYSQRTFSTNYDRLIFISCLQTCKHDLLNQ